VDLTPFYALRINPKETG